MKHCIICGKEAKFYDINLTVCKNNHVRSNYCLEHKEKGIRFGWLIEEDMEEIK